MTAPERLLTAEFRISGVRLVPKCSLVSVSGAWLCLYGGSYTNESMRAARNLQIDSKSSSNGGPSAYQGWS